MFDPSRLLDQMMRSGVRHMGKKGKKRKKGWQAGRSGLDRLAHGAGVPGGALGLLGGLAIAAYEHYSQQQQGQQGAGQRPPPPPPGGPPPPPGAPGQAAAPPPPPPPAASATPAAPATAPGVDDADHARLLIEAMIEAAKADGVIDPEERRQILERLEASGADDEGRAFVGARMATPPAQDQLISRVNPADPARRHLAAEIYAASALAIEIDTEAERAYLQRLGEGLRLDAPLRRHIHESLGLEPL